MSIATDEKHLQKYILHLHRYFTSEDQKYKDKNMSFARAAEEK